MAMDLPRYPNLPKLLKRRPRSGSGDFSWDYADYTAGNSLELHVRGATLYPRMLEDIESARETVHLETYTFGNDGTGRRFAELLAARSRAGVRVRVIFDAVGSLDLDPSIVMGMRNAGVQTLEYHPVAPWRPRWAWNRRDHRKILVCDGKIGYTGGANITDENLPEELGGGDWRDAHVRVEGPAAYDLDRLFRSVWYAETRRWFASEGRPAERRGSSPVKIVHNHEILNRLAIREAYVNALRAAREDVSIANSYFIPDWRIRRSLAQAAKRGASVRVLVPGDSDVVQVKMAMRALYGSLLTRGVRLFEYQGPMMHAKAAVVDAQWCAVGSYNLDRRSLQHNLEVNLHTVDRAFALQLLQHFEQGVAGSREITLDDWRRRPLAQRLLDRFWLSFEYFF